jgi:hypothetical protein
MHPAAAPCLRPRLKPRASAGGYAATTRGRWCPIRVQQQQLRAASGDFDPSYGGKSLDCEADMGDVEKGIHDILSRAATKAATEALWRDQQPPEFQPKRCG